MWHDWCLSVRGYMSLLAYFLCSIIGTCQSEVTWASWCITAVTLLALVSQKLYQPPGVLQLLHCWHLSVRSYMSLLVYYRCVAWVSVKQFLRFLVAVHTPDVLWASAIAHSFLCGEHWYVDQPLPCQHSQPGIPAAQHSRIWPSY